MTHAFDAKAGIEIVKYLRLGVPLYLAAQASGIAPARVEAWIEAGNALEDDSEIAVFAREVPQAIAQAEMRELLVIRKAAEKDWRAAAWKLERNATELPPMNTHSVGTQNQLAARQSVEDVARTTVLKIQRK